jgi:hypothetical protein
VWKCETEVAGKMQGDAREMKYKELKTAGLARYAMNVGLGHANVRFVRKSERVKTWGIQVLDALTIKKGQEILLAL